MSARNLYLYIALIGIALSTSVMFQNCAPVSFKPEVASEALAAKGDEASLQPALCDDGQVSGAVKWDLVIGQNIEEAGQCENGGNLLLIYEKNQKLVCENGKYIGSNDFKRGNLIGQRGGCNCADGVSNGMITWKNIIGQNITELQSCPANGSLSLIYEKLQKFTCDNGKLVSSDEYQKGKLVRQDGSCKCADGSTEGSSSFKVVLNATITEAGLCLYGGDLQYIYEKQQKYICQMSQSLAQNEFMKGKLPSTTGACGCQGGVPSGGFKFTTLSGQTISEPVTCKYDGNLVNIYEKQEKNLCSNGAFSTTGMYQKGIFLRQEGACNPPPVLNESLSIATTKTLKPLDMVWVVDNSGSMTEEAANVRKNITNFINSLDKSSDMKLLLMSLQGNSGNAVSLPPGLDPARFMQVNKEIGSKDGPKLLGDQLMNFKNSGTPFFRTDSKKIIVFVTDDNSATSAANFMSNLTSVGVTSTEVSIFGFIGLGSSLSKCQANTGAVYQTLATQTGGNVYNICNLDWTQHFSDLKTDVLTKLGRTFTLKDVLAVKIVKLEVDGLSIASSKYTFINGVLSLATDVSVTELSVIKVYYTRE